MNKKQPKVSKDFSDKDKTLNLLIIEHLMSKELWFTCSVMASEAEFIEPPPEIETVITGATKITKRRHNPAKLRTASISNILRNLDNPNLFSQMASLEDYYLKNRSKSFLDLCLSKEFQVSNIPIRPKNTLEDDFEVPKISQRETALNTELEILKCQVANLHGIKAENEDLKAMLESQKQEIEKLRLKNHQEENEPPRVNYNVKSYLAGVKVNLEALDKETAILEEDICKNDNE
eukprot:02684.XXX_55242_54262_1 [CDS] Oithona nana genome sequencing.